MADEKKYKALATGKLAINGKIRSVDVLAATLSFKKTEDGEAKIYDAEEIVADAEILSALVKSKSSYVVVLFSDTDEDAPAAAEAETAATGDNSALVSINAGLQKKVEELSAANAVLSKENEDQKAHIELLESENAKLQAGPATK